jgi:hypothetical protein
MRLGTFSCESDDLEIHFRQCLGSGVVIQPRAEQLLRKHFPTKGIRFRGDFVQTSVLDFGNGETLEQMLHPQQAHDLIPPAAIAPFFLMEYRELLVGNSIILLGNPIQDAGLYFLFRLIRDSEPLQRWSISAMQVERLDAKFAANCQLIVCEK